MLHWITDYIAVFLVLIEFRRTMSCYSAPFIVYMVSTNSDITWADIFTMWVNTTHSIQTGHHGLLDGFASVLELVVSVFGRKLFSSLLHTDLLKSLIATILYISQWCNSSYVMLHFAVTVWVLMSLQHLTFRLWRNIFVRPKCSGWRQNLSRAYWMITWSMTWCKSYASNSAQLPELNPVEYQLEILDQSIRQHTSQTHHQDVVNYKV